MKRPGAYGFLLVMLALFVSLSGCATDITVKSYYDSIVVVDPDLSAKADGSYQGSHILQPPFGIWVANPKAEVEVTIADHRYSAIVVVGPKTLEGFQHLEVLKGLILERQSLQVDALSGATSLTGKAYLKAIEDALD